MRRTTQICLFCQAVTRIEAEADERVNFFHLKDFYQMGSYLICATILGEDRMISAEHVSVCSN